MPTWRAPVISTALNCPMRERSVASASRRLYRTTDLLYGAHIRV
ncbi:hypothetical protein [Actinomyces sp. oral taxon 414]|nr:hypothetical protein [Actinomyces sp. oral taxon 414]